ncbi:ABC transporter ATP-binding protein [Streptomyces radicis]|uniref:ABC transporter ATP-binding protein n=1 Tax=Streptomyces radicis TaxID=1750517 RepID=A0A3A9WF73_9ACTN|nr:ABC transporter ATP-binding protein [Streptomyces radicis]RKN06316.1 ABC transporter ATP-binding protein [Streptomyces radicis]RKN18646.1 ABC transporter ATP-binding protein [Streptomyces radicis]
MSEPTSTAVAAPPVLTLTSLAWSIGGATIVGGVDLTVAEGELLALIGPNGAGKTSLFNLVSGVTRPTGGTITLAGVYVHRLPPHRRARLGLGRTFQSSSVFPTMTVAEHVELAARAAGARRVTGTDTAGVLERVRLSHRAAELAGGLSHGDKRKLELAMLLAPTIHGDGPRLMLLDEPMAGVAAEEVGELTEVIRWLHREEGRTLLMVEHHMDVVIDLADRIAVLHHGVLLAQGDPAAVMADPEVQRAYLGEEL